jgi:NADPH-dependent F420 reductase
MIEHKLCRIGILGGTGNLGPGLALRWAKAGYGVVIGSRQEEKAQGVAAALNDQLGRSAIQGMQNAQAAMATDVCVLTVHAEAHATILESLRNVLQGRILVDATARVDFRNPKPPAAPAAARMAQDILGPKVVVVAAFQTVPAHVLRSEWDRPLDQDVLVFGDDVQAAEQVVRLAGEAGMKAYSAGGLDNAIVAEGLVALLLAMNKRYKSRRGTLKVIGIDA